MEIKDLWGYQFVWVIQESVPLFYLLLHCIIYHVFIQFLKLRYMKQLVDSMILIIRILQASPQQVMVIRNIRPIHGCSSQGRISDLIATWREKWLNNWVFFPLRLHFGNIFFAYPRTINKIQLSFFSLLGHLEAHLSKMDTHPIITATVTL